MIELLDAGADVNIQANGEVRGEILTVRPCPSPPQLLERGMLFFQKVKKISCTIFFSLFAGQYKRGRWVAFVLLARPRWCVSSTVAVLI